MDDTRFARPFRRFSALAAFALLASLSLAAQTLPPQEADAPAQLLGSPRHGEWVSYDAGGGDRVRAWIVYPERADKAPVVIVIHEIFGLTDWVRGVVDRLAAEGFIALAPDLLSGKAPDGRGGSEVLGQEGARAVLATLDPAEITRRLDAAAAYATALPSATKAYGVLGFCWGGGISFNWATQQAGLKAAVVYYGTSPATAALARVAAPVLGLYGGADARVTSTVPDAKAEMDRLGLRYETAIYPGAGHAFLRQLTGQNGANLAAAQAAWPRTLAFLSEALEAGGRPMGRVEGGPAALLASAAAGSGGIASAAAIDAEEADCPDCAAGLGTCALTAAPAAAGLALSLADGPR